MKKALRIIISIMIVILSVGLVVRFLPSSSVPSPDSSTNPPNVIEYKAVIDGKVCEIPEFLYYADGSYPAEYTSGEALKISDLKGRMSVSDIPQEENELPIISMSGYPDPKDAQKEYEFYGWYLGEELTDAFEGRIETEGKKTLYAKISVAYWTKFY